LVRRQILIIAKTPWRANILTAAIDSGGHQGYISDVLRGGSMRQTVAPRQDRRAACRDFFRKTVPCLTTVALTFAIIIAAGCATSEPRLTVSGIVKDAESGQPLAGATVSDDGYGIKPFRGATTDSAGKYQYRTWYEEHNIIALAPGYKAQRLLLRTSLWRRKTEIELNFSLVRQ
jgi:hypothetical protein